MTAEGIKAMAVDLDGTLLHPEPEAIQVRGRSGYRYMSKTEFLVHISRSMPLIIATGRNAQSVHNLVKQIDDLKIAGFVMENGLVARRHLFSECGNERSEIFAGAKISFQNSGAYNGFKTRFTVPECKNERSEIFADAEISFQNSGAYNGFKTRFTVPECGNERSEIFAGAEISFQN
ncbi:MAG: hypothetical protein BWK80_45585, partial [Desulfobacteraceae bacterium IS3]